MSWYSNSVPVHGGNIQIKSTTRAEARRLMPNQQGFQDWSTLSQLYEEDPLKTNLKLQQWFGQKEEVRMPSIFEDAVANDAVLEVNGWEGTFNYDMPVETDNRIKTVDDYSYQNLAGADGTTFKLALNREFAPGTQLTCDGLDGMAIVVSEAEPVHFVNGGFEHTFILLTDDPDKSYPSYLLEKDIEYFDLGTNIGEYTEKFGLVHMPGVTDYNTYEFMLGSPQAVETAATAKANMTDLGYGTAASKDYFREVEKFYQQGNEVAIIMDNNPKSPSKYTIASILEMLAIQKFNVNMASYLMFSQGGTVPTSKGTVRYNEGLWRQMRRGYIITYGRRGGITRSHIKAAKDYVFKANPYKGEIESRLKFKCGTEAFNNVLEIFREEVNFQLSNLAPLLGADRILPENPVSGSLYDLQLKPVRFTKVYLPGIGLVEIEEDRTLNFVNVTDKNLRGMNPNGMDYTTYSMFIWDAADQYYSNNADYPRGTRPVGNNSEANIYLVTPKDNKIFWGREQGRYNVERATDIVAANKSLTTSFFIYGFGAMWMKDPSKVVSVELEKSARKGYK